ncbi:MAG TPA: 50S ribosomal protein L7/L12 [Firmicutes bacterium]|nr:50S ribosomal protein L7/L12 [Bacillota bacterium]
MAKLTKEEFIAAIKEMTVVELTDLVHAIEEEFGVTAAVAVAAGAPAEETKEEGPSEVTLTLTSFGASKVAVIKAVQAILGIGLMDAKKIVDAVPSVVKEKISPTEAETYKKQLVDAGAEVEIK